MCKFGSLDEQYDPNDPCLINLSGRLLIVGIGCFAWLYKILFPLAKKDGFENDFEMWDWFKGEYGAEMFTKKFMVLRWKP